MKITGILVLALKAGLLLFPETTPDARIHEFPQDCDPEMIMEWGEFADDEEEWSTPNGKWNLVNNGKKICIDRNPAGRCRGNGEITFDSKSDEFFLVHSTNNGRLLSPEINTTGFSSIQISFWHHYKNDGRSDKGVLEYRTEDRNWREVETYTDTEGAHNNFKKVEFYLPRAAEGKSKLRFRFRYDGGNDGYWTVDEFKVRGIRNGGCEENPINCSTSLDLPVTWDFNDEKGANCWANPSSDDDKEWKLVQDGTIAYSEWVCTDRRWNSCHDWENINYKFHSNDDSDFYLVSSYNEDDDYENVNLISPSFNTLDKTGIKLSFWHHYRDGNSSRRREYDTGYLEYTTDGGENWEIIKTYQGDQGEHDDFEYEEAPLPSEAENKPEVNIRFRYDDADDDYFWAVDNLSIRADQTENPDNPEDPDNPENPGNPGDPNNPEGPSNPGNSDQACENVEIRANFCAGTAEERIIELTSLYEYDSYRWYDTYGNPVPDDEGGHSRSIRTNLAGTYTLEVHNENGCSAQKTITTAEELVENGDFEADNEGSFETDYRYIPNYDGDGNALGPEGTYSIDRDANDYHTSFFGKDHTTGEGKFLMVNGATDNSKVIWKKTIKNIQPNTDYYFSAWGMNLNPSEPAELQFKLNGKLIGIAADLSEADKPTRQDQVNRGNWEQFYMPSWNSGDATEVTLEIVNNNDAAGGNDFGIDDISFGNLDPISFRVEPPENLTVCKGHTLRLYSNIHGGRAPVTYTWTNKEGEVISNEKDPVIENAQVSDAGTYNLAVTDFYGCEPVTASIKVNVDDHCHNLNFDGVDDYAILGNAYNFEGSFALEAWIKPNSLTGTKSILSKTDADTLSEGGYALTIENKKIGFWAKDNKITYNDSEITTDRWHHIAATYNGDSNVVKIYVDGIEFKEGKINEGLVSTSKPFMIGGMYNRRTPWEPSHYFDGFIEEVRIWNRTLTTEQIQFMMNQRLEKNAAGKVIGQVIPMEVPGEIPWSDLKGYYPLRASDVEHNEEEHDENHGITKDEAEEKTRGYLMNMQDNQENTAPLPYVLYVQNGDWWDKSTWTLPEVLNGEDISQRTVLDPPNSNGIDHSTSIEWNIVEIGKNIESYSDITLLGLYSKSETLDMKGSIPLNQSAKPRKESGSELKIIQYLRLDGVIDLNGESQLIQIPGSILDLKSNGRIERDQQGTASSFNYNYWSSPVSTELFMETGTAKGYYRIKDVLKDGSNPNAPIDIDFGSPHSYADGGKTTPIKISTYWINKFFGEAGNYSQWRPVGINGILKAGEGFTMKGTHNVHVNSGKQQNYVFTGIPNNGDIHLEVGTNTNYLIGNPYPSAIDANEFIKDNLEIRRGRNVFNGSLYFWSHFSGRTHVLKEYVGGYATYNLSGGVRAVANDFRVKNNNNKGGEIPQRYIPVGQAFFVNTVLDENITNWETSNEAPSPISGGEIQFKNSQRIFITESENSLGESVFHRPEVKPTKKENQSFDKRKKIWLEFRSPEGYHRQILVTADLEATQDFDIGYDGPLNDNVPEDMYWQIQDSKFVIQGVSNFSKGQELPLGLKIATDSIFSIRIDQLENIPDELDIYLRDSVQETFHNLREKPFEAMADSVTVDNRYSLVFRDTIEIPEDEEQGTDEDQKPESVGDGEQGVTEGEEEKNPTLLGMELFYSQSHQTLTIKNPQLKKIYRVWLVNTAGQKVWEYLHPPTKEKSDLPLETFTKGVYIVKIDCGKEMTGKILIE